MSVTAARGFRASGVRAGLKASGKPDLALVVNDGPLDTAAGVFTSNRVVAAPVVWSRRLLAGQEGGQPGHARAVVLNSGSANACTGTQGMHDTEATAARTAGLLGAEPGQVLVCSTGVIGERIDMPVLLEGVDVAALALADTSQAGTDAATAIMTTDTVSKEDALTVGAGDQGWTIGGMIKGVGMLAPGMATMLAVITTDAALTPQQAQDALASATARTVNRINSDGCMSTNDTVLLLASGASGTTPSRAELDEALTEVMSRLGRRLVADAEGATHDIAITVSGAVSEEAAEAAARTVSSSNLLKCAVAGADPNWGVSSPSSGPCPRTSAPSTPTRSTSPSTASRSSATAPPQLNRDAVDMSPRETRIDIELSAGWAEATVWTNDLTHGYVTINADYTT